MSIRTMVEINHDFTPHTEEGKREFMEELIRYLGSGNPDYLPGGVTFFHQRHHSDPCPLGDEPNFGWNNSGKLR